MKIDLKKNYIKVFSSIALICCVFIGYSQKKDDVYGYKTTRYFYENDIVNHTDTSYVLDSLYEDFHQFDPRPFGKYLFQNLGTIGSASKPLNFLSNPYFGQQSGILINEALSPKAEKNKYYATYSPYTELTFVQSSNRILRLDGTFSKNVSKTWNIGLDIKRFRTVSNIGPASQSDYLSNYHGFKVFTSYFSKNSKYKLLGNYRYMRNEVNESGGIKLNDPENVNYNDFYQNQNLLADQLSGTLNLEKRNSWRVFQEYKLSNSEKNDGLFIYNILNREVKQNLFETKLADYYKVFYDMQSNSTTNKIYNNLIGINATKINENIIFEEDLAELGLSYFKKKITFKLYAQERYWKAKSDSMDALSNLEHHVGANFKYRITNKGSIFTENRAVFINSTLLKYTYSGIRTKWFEFSYKYKDELPSVSMLGYNALYWGSNVTDTVNGSATRNIDKITTLYNEGAYATQNVNFSAQISSLKNMVIRFGADINLLEKYYYYTSDAASLQYDQNVLISSYFVKLRGKSKSFRYKLEARYLTSNSDFVRLPNILANGQLYYQRFIYDKKVLIQLGMDAGYRSSYVAEGYSPYLRNFYIQNKINLDDYVIVEPFANFQIKQRFILSLRLSHATQGLMGRGYLVSPFYAGQKRAIEIGINWKFFD